MALACTALRQAAEWPLLLLLAVVCHLAQSRSLLPLAVACPSPLSSSSSSSKRISRQAERRAWVVCLACPLSSSSSSSSSCARLQLQQQRRGEQEEGQGRLAPCLGPRSGCLGPSLMLASSCSSSSNSSSRHSVAFLLSVALPPPLSFPDHRVLVAVAAVASAWVLHMQSTLRISTSLPIILTHSPPLSTRRTLNLLPPPLPLSPICLLHPPPPPSPLPPPPSPLAPQEQLWLPALRQLALFSLVAAA